jgi:hypothetical protein
MGRRNKSDDDANEGTLGGTFAERGGRGRAISTTCKFLKGPNQRRTLRGYLCDMTTESKDAAALLEGMGDELAVFVRAHFDALKETPVVADPAAVERVMKVVVAVGRANLMVRAVKAAEDKLSADKAKRLLNPEQMKMNDITPEDLERRAAELRARADSIVALVEAKCGPSRALVRQLAERDRAMDGDEPQRAA